MTRVCETVSVAVNQTGEPIGFSWRGQRYQVVSRPVRWFARKEWWVESARAQRGIGAGVLEIEMWRFIASDSRVSLQYELIRNALTNQWQLNRVFEV